MAIISSTRHTSSLRKHLPRYLIHIFFIVLCSMWLFPILLVISASLSDETQIFTKGFSIIPRGFTTESYKYLFNQPEIIIRSYGVTSLVAVVGTASSVFMMALLGYTLSRSRFILRRQFSVYVLITMLFSGGLVPSYLLMTKYLHLNNTVLSLILPFLFSGYLTLILRTYFAGLPEEIFESARLDGAGEPRIFFTFVIPLSVPVLATVGLFMFLAYWNDFFLALLYITNRDLYPLQFLLNQIMTNSKFAKEAAMAGISTNTNVIPLETLRMAMAVVATGPAALVFLLTNRYLISGITLGAFK